MWRALVYIAGNGISLLSVLQPLVGKHSLVAITQKCDSSAGSLNLRSYHVNCGKMLCTRAHGSLPDAQPGLGQRDTVDTGTRQVI